MALIFAIWSAQPNWMPRNPKLMFQIVRNRVGDVGVALARWVSAIGRLILDEYC